jgi:hypothetical protein
MFFCAVGFLAGANAMPVRGQQNRAANVSLPAACGVDNTDFVVKRDSRNSQTAPDVQAPAGKALVYVIEEMPDTAFLTSNVKIGVDGSWIGETARQDYMSFTLDPGIHHLCVTYQGQFAPGVDGGAILHRLHAEPGKTYYLLYRGVFLKEYGEIGFFNEVDEDEGQYLLQLSNHVTATAKKK